MKIFKKRFFAGMISFLLLGLAQHTFAQKNADDLLGTWLTQKKDGKVEIFKQGDKYFGKIIWIAEPNDANGKPKLDKNNPDASKRTQLVVGSTIVKNLEWEGDGEWDDGKVYDPASGKTYSASVKLKDKNTLEFTGFIGISLIGRTETWTRIK